MTPNKFPTPAVEYKANKFTLEKLIELGTYYWAPMLLHTLDGVPELNLPALRGVILAGTPGNGRHTMADALSGTLSKCGYSYFTRIAGAALDARDVSDACAAINGAVIRMRQYTRFCLLVDCPEDSRHNLAIQECLRQQLDDHQGRLFLILITGSATNITPALQTMMTVCQFLRPNLAERRVWFKNSLEGKIPIATSGDVNYITLAKESEGFTWRQMTDLRSLLRRMLVTRYAAEAKLPAAGEWRSLLASGSIRLSRNEVYAALACIRGQGADAMVPAAGAVQYVAAMPAAAVPTGAAAVSDAHAAAKPAAPAPAAAAGNKESKDIQIMSEEEMDANKKAMEFHAKSENMTFQELTSVDDL